MGVFTSRAKQNIWFGAAIAGDFPLPGRDLLGIPLSAAVGISVVVSAT
jgi:hypothetical protein